MILVMRFVFYFLLSFTLLNINLGKKNLFIHLQEITGPLVKKTFQLVENGAKSGLDITKTTIKKMFGNTTPNKTIEEDEINLKKSGLQKNPHEENYTAEEAELLKRLLNE